MRKYKFKLNVNECNPDFSFIYYTSNINFERVNDLINYILFNFLYLYLKKNLFIFIFNFSETKKFRFKGCVLFFFLKVNLKEVFATVRNMKTFLIIRSKSDSIYISFNYLILISLEYYIL